MNSNIKTGLISAYFVIGFFFAIYQHFWGQYSYKSFAYNIGQGLVWPAVMFPTVGKIIGGILILCLVGFLTMRSK
ncbi:hypothetical protein F4U02_12065 [Acinetobacter haemolyticus]|uniref:Uncharacterized protein n=2 Tax=Acinetobacter TaxID=469 RepID=A0A8B5S797_ACIBZ|nr:MULTISPECIES: hypothetical protein [Acinetobacter]ENX07033.1 hypothetical protein F898_01447 [Acinetobacter courvalinii]MBJ9908486.1 hypothetical protein [Acinetobacter bereziniae]MBJ9929824.1 hypothetical protein [Acinetobacter bereziniae]MEC6127156.1 hypothetical protein [Acinetobacter ursingii]MQZ31715.1 hypothetical protein [Acinetobacter haemolyticus]